MRRMRRKTILALLMAAVLMVSVTACSASGKAAKEPEENMPAVAVEAETSATAEEPETAEEMSAVAGEPETEPETDSAQSDGVIFKTEQHQIEEYNENDYLLMEGQYAVPQIIIEENPETAERIQAHLDKVMEAFYAEQEENLLILSDLFESMEGTGMHGSRFLDFSLREASDSVISITVYDEVFLGGAHGSHTSKGMTFDRRTGEYLTFEDIFTDVSAAKEKVTGQILEQMEQKKAEAGADLFFTDTDRNVALLLEEDPAQLTTNWYIEDENLIVIANEYMLAPYAAGAFEFPIPLSSLEALLRKPL